MKHLLASDLDRRIEFLRDGAATHDGLQNVAGQSVILAARWASARPGGGRERFANAENAASLVMVFRVRWDGLLDPDAPSGIQTTDRIRYPAGEDGGLYDIKSATTSGRREGIEIAAVRRAS